MNAKIMKVENVIPPLKTQMWIFGAPTFSTLAVCYMFHIICEKNTNTCYLKDTNIFYVYYTFTTVAEWKITC